MIKKLETYNKIKEYLVDKKISERKFLNISQLARDINISYSTAQKYSLLILEDLKEK